MAAKAHNLDFSNVKESGSFNTRRVPAGDYLAKVTKVEDAQAKDETAMWVFTVKLNKYSQNAYPYYCKLQENQLWKLRNLAIAGGLNVPKKRIKLDPNKLVGKMIGVTMEDDEYEGKEKSVIAAIFPAAELADGAMVDDDDQIDDEDQVDEDVADDDEDFEEEATPAPKAKKKAAPEPEEDEDEDEAEEEAEEEEEDEAPANPYADFDRARLKREIKKLDSAYSVKRSQSDDDLREVLAGLAGGGSEEEEEEEEEAPAPKAKAKSKAKKPAASEVSDDELEELDIDDL
jgi:hypothetical protein